METRPPRDPVVGEDYVDEMTSDSSVDLLLQVSMAERNIQLSHFDSLDTKAGLVLGFAGVLTALVPDANSVLGIVSIGLAGLAAISAVAAFWPRHFPAIDPVRLGDYAASELGFTQLTLLDTMEVMITRTNDLLSTKASRLKVALASLSGSAVFGAINLIGG